MLYGSSADTEDLDSGLGAALALLALPGGFLALLLFNKYGSLLHFLRGETNFDPYAASLPDEYLFIVLAMLVSGGVALWKWDTLFLDRRDTVNIVPLPIHTRQIFVANFLAVLLFATMFCIDVNLASGVLFPIIVSASQESLLYLGKIALGHVVAIIGASLFSFTSIFAIAGLFMAVLTPRVFQAVSLCLRGIILVVLLAFAATGFTVSKNIETGMSYSGIQYLPSVWYLGLCQWCRGDANGVLCHVAFDGLTAQLSVLVVGAVAYALAYRRHFDAIAEITVVKRQAPRQLNSSCQQRLLDWIVRSPFEQAGLRYILKTLARSDRHRATVAAFAAIGFVAATQKVIWSEAAAAGPSTAEFAAPLIILYCFIAGLRSAFDLPIELNANWTFRLLIAPTEDRCARLAGKAIFLLVIPVIVAASVLFALRWGIEVGILECGIVLVLSVSLIAALVLNFRKLPFTCTRAGFQQNALLKVLLGILGLFAFAAVPATVQHWAYLNPVRLLVLVPLLAVAWCAYYVKRSSQLEIERQIVFDECEQLEIALLNLNG